MFNAYHKLSKSSNGYDDNYCPLTSINCYPADGNSTPVPI
jgi:hypothetical protein